MTIMENIKKLKGTTVLAVEPEPDLLALTDRELALEAELAEADRKSTQTLAAREKATGERNRAIIAAERGEPGGKEREEAANAELQRLNHEFERTNILRAGLRDELETVRKDKRRAGKAGLRKETLRMCNGREKAATDVEDAIKGLASAIRRLNDWSGKTRAILSDYSALTSDGGALLNARDLRRILEEELWRAQPPSPTTRPPVDPLPGAKFAAVTGFELRPISEHIKAANARLLSRFDAAVETDQ